MTFGLEFDILHTTPSKFGRFSMHLGGDLEDGTRNILYLFIDGQVNLACAKVIIYKEPTPSQKSH